MLVKRCPSCQNEYSATLPTCPQDGTSLREVIAVDPMIGQVLEGKYRIESLLGSGGMAAVYLATHRELDSKVAIKVLSSESLKNSLAVARFRREAQAVAKIRHRSVVAIYDIGKLPSGNTFLVMEYIEGHSLREELKKHKRLDIRRAVQIATEICEGMQAAHDVGIIHRDLKPENIMIESRKSNSYIKIVDFGVAELCENAVNDALTRLTEAGMMVGTPYYISPEQCKGEELDHRSDIYSLGIMLYELLTGEVPFRGRTLSAVILQHVSEPAPSIRQVRPEVSKALESVVLSALSKSKEDRPASMLEFAQELTRAVEQTASLGNTIVGSSLSVSNLPSATNTGSIKRTTGQIRRTGMLTHDSLTGLHSYVYFLGQLEEAVARALQTGESLVVALIGIDRFKKFNEHGYLVGDQVLREVATLVNKRVPSEAKLSRLEGDNFVLMLTGQYAKEADLLLENIVRTVEETEIRLPVLPESFARVSISVGTAVLREHAQTASELIDFAKQSLRQAKQRKYAELATDSTPQISFEHFVGRRKELEKLQKELELTVSGKGRVLFISGDAGVGKSRLVDEFRRRLIGKDILFLQGRFYESGGTVPYKVFYDSLRSSIHYLAENSEELELIFGPLSERVRQDFADDDSISSLLGSVTLSGNAEQEKYKLFDYLSRIYSSLSHVRPVVLFLDDLQWADELALDFLSYLTRVVQHSRVFVIATMREWEVSSEQSPVRSWLRQMGRYCSYEQIKLSPLTESEVRQIIDQTFGKIQISPGTLSLICSETKGNAFYLMEVMRLLIQDEVIRWVDGRWRVEDVNEIRLPTSVVDLVEAHLAKLPDKTLEIFVTAAVLGDGFSFDVLASVTDMDEDDLLPIIEEGLKKRIIKEEVSGREERYVFYQSTMRKVLYERVSRRRRKKLHQQIGHKLEEMYGSKVNKIAAELAYHYYQAEDYGRSLKYSIEAGNLAWRVLAVSEALKYYEWTEKSIRNLMATLREEGGKGSNQVLQLAACGLHIEVDALALYHLNYGRLLMQIGHHSKAEAELRQTLELARQLKSLKLMGRAFTALGELYRQYGQLTRGLEYGEQGLTLLSSTEDTEWEVQALLVVGAAHEGLGAFSSALETYKSALALARKLRDQINEANALWGIGFTYYRFGQYERARASAQQGLDIATKSNDKLGQQRCHSLLGSVYLGIGRFEEGLKHFESALRIARELGYRLSESVILNNIGECFRLRKMYKDARENYEQALLLAQETNDRVTQGIVKLSLGLVEQDKGNYNKSLELLEEALRLACETGATPTQLEISLARGKSLFELGKIEEALEHYHHALDLARHSGSPVFEWQALYGLAKCERRLGNAAEALKLVQLSLEIVEQMSSDLKSSSDRENFLRDKQMLYLDLVELTEAKKIV